LNCGAGNVDDENILCGIEPKDYVDLIKSFLNFFVSLFFYGFLRGLKRVYNPNLN